MQVQATRPLTSPLMRRTRRGDRIMQGLIVGGGLSVLLMLAWAHLGLSALVFPPAATPARMVAVSGPYTVTLVADSGQLVTGGGNLMSFVVRDRAGQPVVGATVRVHADMTTMAMPVPDASATAQGGGRYTAQLLFTMAGPWRLTVMVAAPGQAAAWAAFDVGVRWR